MLTDDSKKRAGFFENNVFTHALSSISEIKQLQ